MKPRTSDRHMIKVTIRLTKKLCEMKYFLVILNHNSYSFTICSLSVVVHVLFRFKLNFDSQTFSVTFRPSDPGVHIIFTYISQKRQVEKQITWYLTPGVLLAMSVCCVSRLCYPCVPGKDASMQAWIPAVVLWGAW